MVKRNFSIYGIIERNICELFVNVPDINNRKAFMIINNTFFFTGGIFINNVDLLQTYNTKIKGTMRFRQIFPDDLTYTTQSSDSIKEKTHDLKN